MQDEERVETRLELGYNVLSTRITTCRRVRGQLKVGVFRVRVRRVEKKETKGEKGRGRAGEKGQIYACATERILRKDGHLV